MLGWEALNRLANPAHYRQAHDFMAKMLPHQQFTNISTRCNLISRLRYEL